MNANIYTPVSVEKGCGDTDGNPSIKITFAGCISEIAGESLTEREAIIFKSGILAEQERVWNRLADIIKDKALLNSIKYDELFNA